MLLTLTTTHRPATDLGYLWVELTAAGGKGMVVKPALREHGLGLESLERFVRNEPLWSVHQTAFAVLALESEPVDPRL